MVVDLRCRCETVANTGFGHDIFRTVRVLFNFFPQLCNEYPQVLRLVYKARAPYLSQ